MYHFVYECDLLYSFMILQTCRLDLDLCPTCSVNRNSSSGTKQRGIFHEACLSDIYVSNDTFVLEHLQLSKLLRCEKSTCHLLCSSPDRRVWRHMKVCNLALWWPGGLKQQH